MFSCEFCEIFKNTFFTEYIWATASDMNFLCTSNLGRVSLDQIANLNHISPWSVLQNMKAYYANTYFIVLASTHGVVSSSGKLLWIHVWCKEFWLWLICNYSDKNLDKFFKLSSYYLLGSDYKNRILNWLSVICIWHPGCRISVGRVVIGNQL